MKIIIKRKRSNITLFSLLYNDGVEFWNARELTKILQYKKWENFSKVIDRAKLACQNSGRDIDDDFPEVSKIVEAGATQKKIKDYELKFHIK